MRRALILAAFLIPAAAASAADDFRPRVIFTWESRETGEITTSRLRQEIDLYLTRTLTDTIEVRFNLGANHYTLANERPGFEDPGMRALEFRPSGAISARFGVVDTETEYALRRTRSDFGERRSERDDEQMRTQIGWGARRFVPGATLRASRNRLQDRDSSTSILNDTVEGTLNYIAGPLAVSAGQTYRLDSDSRSGYERTTTDQLASLTFAEAWFDGKLTATAGANGSLSRIDDEAGRVSRIPTFVRPSRALWGVDDTPLESNDHPLSSYPTLIDSRTSVSTGISLGPDASSFQAIAFDIGRVSPVDTIQIVVRDDKLETVTLPAGIQWDVFTSVDGVRWERHVALLDQTFDTVRSLYEISFEQVDTRWIKVVSFGVAAQPVFVTEGLILFHIERQAGSNDSDFRTIASSASLTFTPVRQVSFGYNGAGYESSQESGDSLQSDVRDTTHQFSARYDPGTKLGFDARYELRDSRTDRLSQESNSLSGSIRFTPRPQFSGSLMCDRRNELFDDRLLDSRTCATQFTARIFPTLDVTIGGSDRDQTLEEGGSLQTRSFYATTNARVTPSLRLTLSASASRSAYDEWDGTAAPPANDDRLTADIDWVRGRALGLGGTFGWVRGDAFSGLVQRYRVRWSPFGDGSVSLMTSYTQDIDPYSDSRSERLLFSPRWQINSSAALNLVYTSVKTTGERTFESESVLASLILGR